MHESLRDFIQIIHSRLLLSLILSSYHCIVSISWLIMFWISVCFFSFSVKKNALWYLMESVLHFEIQNKQWFRKKHSSVACTVTLTKLTGYLCMWCIQSKYKKCGLKFWFWKRIKKMFIIMQSDIKVSLIITCDSLYVVVCLW